MSDVHDRPDTFRGIIRPRDNGLEGTSFISQSGSPIRKRERFGKAYLASDISYLPISRCDRPRTRFEVTEGAWLPSQLIYILEVLPPHDSHALSNFLKS